MKTFDLEAEARVDAGKNKAKALKKQGLVPSVVYGEGGDARTITFQRADLESIYRRSSRGLNTLINLVISDNGKKETQVALSHQIDVHPITRKIIHVDFLKVREDKYVDIEAKVVLNGPAKGQKHGGVIVQNRTIVQLRCLPTAIPDQVDVDITPLGIGELIRAGDLKVGEGVEVLTDPDRVIMHIEPPKVDKSLLATEEAPATADSSEEGSAATEDGES